jgi:deazaflavin-dependent oxidoreductase (nitroreductase family)
MTWLPRPCPLGNLALASATRRSRIARARGLWVSGRLKMPGPQWHSRIPAPFTLTGRSLRRPHALGIMVVRKVGSRIDPALIRLTGGRLSFVAPFPAMLLTHTGAKSGVTRTSTVVYFTDADRVIVIASNFGVPHRPAWYYNVKAYPEVTLSGRGFGGSFHAEELVGPERDRLFQLATGASSPYDHYQRTARKPVPVIAFHPSR